MPSLKVGDPAPDVAFTMPDRTTVQLTSFKESKNVVVAFYPRAFTGGCEREMRFFQTQISHFEAQDTKVFGSSTDAVAPQKAFADHCGLSFPLISDHPNFQMAKAFGVYDAEKMVNKRVTFVIDKKGVIRHVIEDRQDMESHGKESLEVIKRLG